MPGEETAAGVRVEQRGPHWIAWIADENGRPRGSIVLVGQTREEAETRARHWGEKLRGDSAARHA